MRYVITAAGFNDEKVHDVTILAKKINGFWTKHNGSVGFVCNHDIQIIHMTEEEQAMPVSFEPGYPGMG